MELSNLDKIEWHTTTNVDYYPQNRTTEFGLTSGVSKLLYRRNTYLPTTTSTRSRDNRSAFRFKYRQYQNTLQIYPTQLWLTQSFQGRRAAEVLTDDIVTNWKEESSYKIWCCNIEVLDLCKLEIQC